MKTGVLFGLTFEQYQAIDAINVSGLKLIKQSPLHYWAKYLAPDRPPEKQSDAMYRGTAIHAALLEPARFASEYRVKPEPDDYPDHLNTMDDLKRELRTLGLPLGGAKADLTMRLREASTTFKYFEDVVRDHEKYKLLSKADMEACTNIASQIRKHPALSILFEEGQHEVTLVWVDEEMGCLCKARIDWLTRDGVIVDPKSTTDASLDEFIWSFERFGYWQQAAWYLDGVKATLGIDGTFIFAAFEVMFPFATAMYAPNVEAIGEGRAENRALLRKYAECKKSGYWPGYPDLIQPIYRPKRKTNSAATPAMETF